MEDIVNTSQIRSVKSWEEKKPGDGIMASHINEIQEELIKIERGLVNADGTSELQKIQEDIATMKNTLNNLAASLKGDGLNISNGKLTVPVAGVTSKGSVQLVNYSSDIHNPDDVITWGTLPYAFNQRICDPNEKIPASYIATDLMSSFVFAGIITLKPENGKIIIHRNDAYNGVPLGGEFADSDVTSCYYLIKVNATGQDEDGNDKPIYSIEGSIYDPGEDDDLWEGATVKIDDGAWLQGSVIDQKIVQGKVEKTWTWSIIDRSQEFKIDTPDGLVTQDASNVFDLRTPLSLVYERVRKMEEKLASYHPYYLGVLVTEPINIPKTSRGSDRAAQHFRLKLPGGQKDFRKMRWWVARAGTPVFEALSAVEINTAMETTSGSMVEREPIAYYRRGPEGTNQGHIWSKYLQGWDYENTQWPMYKGGILFGDWSLGLKDANLTWDSTKNLWVLSFELYKAFNDTQSFTSEGETIYYEFYS